MQKLSLDAFKTEAQTVLSQNTLHDIKGGQCGSGSTHHGHPPPWPDDVS